MILIFIPNGLGDILMLIPSLRRLICLYGIKKIVVVVASKAHKDLLNSIVSSELECLCRFDGWPLTQLRLFIKIFKKRFDICFCPLISNKLINKIFFLLSLTTTIFPSKISLPFPSNILQNSLNLNDYNGHQVNYFIDFFKNYCADLDISKINYSEVKIINSVLFKKNLNENSGIYLAIGLSCGLKERHKIPSPVFFSRVVNELATKISVRVLVFGISSDLELIQIFEKNVNVGIKITKAIDLSIVNIIAKLSECDVGMVGTTGQGHMMAAAGLPLLITAGVTDPYESGPYVERAYILRHKYECGPCYQEKFLFGCGSVQCMETLDVGQGVTAIERLYSDKEFGKFWLDLEHKKDPVSINKIEKNISKIY